MCEADHPPFPGAIAAQPIGIMKEDAWNGTSNATK